MGELISISWPSHAKYLCEGIWRSLEESYKTDFVISVSTNESVQRLVKAHQLILSIFCSTIKNADEKILEFGQQSSVNEETLKFLLEFVYKGKTKIAIEKMHDLKLLAETMGFQTLVKSIKSCQKYQELRKNNIEKAKKAKKIAVNTVPKDYRDLFIPIEINVEMNETESKFKNSVDGVSSSENIENDTEKELVAVASLAEKSDSAKFKEYCSKLRLKYKNKVVSVSSKRTTKVAIPKKTKSKYSALFDRKTQTCKLCDKQFATKKHFELHIRSHLEPDSKIQCPHCDSKYFDANYLESHVALKHSVDMQGNPLEKKYKCNECDYSSVSLQRLSAHKIKHKEKSHKCDQCSYSCYQSCDLKLHKEGVHSDLRPYVCDTCGYRAKTMHSYRSHLNVHQQKVTCEECGAVFSSRNMQRHKIRVHSNGVKAAKCHLCPYETACRIYLGRHLRSAHNVQLSKRQPSSLKSQFEVGLG